jgi:predicted dehydrogenase
MKSFAILGSGFGLYGYLPALLQAGVQQIVLPERYRSRFFDRPELTPFASNVQWEANEDSVLDRAEGAVLALRPFDQGRWIPQCLARPNIKSMFLEKPLAHSPEVATVIFEDLIHSNKAFRFGHIFRYTTWGKQLLNSLLSNSAEVNFLSIQWSFLAHHFRYNLSNWKRFNATGGGAIRFYGIQIIALLAEIGYSNVISSRAFGISLDETEKWIAAFEGPDLPMCEILVNTRSTVSKFQVEQIFNAGVSSQAVSIVNQSDPFDEQNAANQLVKTDRRVSLLSQLYSSLYEKSINYYEGYNATIKLWGITEEKTKFETIQVNP